MKMPNAAGAAALRDRRIVKVLVYADGFVPNSYKWKTRGTRYAFHRPVKEGRALQTAQRARFKDTGHLDWPCTTETYDRRRSQGAGPNWTAFSERGGLLASG